MGLSMGHEAFDRYHETHMQTRWHTQCPSATLFTMACPPSASCIETILWHLVENPWPTDGLAEIVRSPPAQMVSMRYFHVFSWFHVINVSHKILGDASVALVEIEINWLENSANCSLSRFCFCSDEFTWCFDDPLHGKIMGWHDNEYITKTTVTQGVWWSLKLQFGSGYALLDDLTKTHSAIHKAKAILGNLSWNKTYFMLEMFLILISYLPLYAIPHLALIHPKVCYSIDNEIDIIAASWWFYWHCFQHYGCIV